MSLFQSIGDRMKGYERDMRTTLQDDKPFIIRLDGKSFHSYTKGLNRPYDENLTSVMQKVMADLLEFSNAQLGYTQSDEITLVYFKLNPAQQLFFDGQVQKLTSIMAARASVVFNKLMELSAPDHFNEKGFALFDARVFQLPNMKEAANNVMWRQMDCKKNSITMAASHYFSHKELHKVNSSEKIEMLKSVGVDYSEYPESFKSGTFAMRTGFLSMGQDHTGEYVNVRRNKTLIFFNPDLNRSIKNLDEFLFDPIKDEYKETVAYKNSRKATK